MTAELAEYYTRVEDYLSGERISQQKHEYLAGIIYAMAGTTIQHDLVAGNTYRSLGNHLAGKPCFVFSSDIRVRIQTSAVEFYYYPDVTVDCGAPAGSSVLAEEPTAIFEVLSPDTERIDRGEKLANYQAIPSLQLFALVDQFQIAITAYRRQENGWKMEFLTDKDDDLDLGFIGCALPLSAIYERTFLARSTA